ncbi:MAG: aldehyde dehydrogenase family protein [Labilithrix sp.]|nr:aldehyde dehydrogenase family protein [Labilithrix sp.]
MEQRIVVREARGVDRKQLVAEAKRRVTEAFDAGGRLLSPVAGSWIHPAGFYTAIASIDGGAIAELPTLSAPAVAGAVEAVQRELPAWAERSLAERIDAVRRATLILREHRDLLVALLAWEIGKTLKTAGNDVDRCLVGVEWYLGECARMLEGRRPIGVVSNIASWNYPFSVLLMTMLVQALAGNAVIAKSPAQGGGLSLTLAVALARRAGVPLSLVGGRGRDLTEPLVGHSALAGVAFVGGRANGAAVLDRLRGTGKRYALEMEGVNAYAVTAFSDWAGLEKQIRAGFEYGKQRCTAYTRWVVERSLVPSFVETYARAASSIRVGHPLLDVAVDFGPLINAAKVDELGTRIREARALGAETLFEGTLAEDAFLPDQSRAAYLAPTLLTGLAPQLDLYQREPFGPVDVLVAVDSDDELVREANVSSGALVASVATDDVARGERLAARLMAFKTGINALRSRGDKEEAFGGRGASWHGSFVGGTNLVLAFTDGDARCEGNFGG